MTKKPADKKPPSKPSDPANKKKPTKTQSPAPSPKDKSDKLDLGVNDLKLSDSPYA